MHPFERSASAAILRPARQQTARYGRQRRLCGYNEGRLTATEFNSMEEAQISSRELESRRCWQCVPSVDGDWMLGGDVLAPSANEIAHQIGPDGDGDEMTTSTIACINTLLVLKHILKTMAYCIKFVPHWTSPIINTERVTRRLNFRHSHVRIWFEGY